MKPQLHIAQFITCSLASAFLVWKNMDNDILRLGGAQIPCTKDVTRNVETLKETIDWAAKNNVAYTVTPEGSLSGYYPEFDERFEDIKDAEKEVVSYAAKNGVGLVLGTMWIETYDGVTPVRENQQRFYHPEGILVGKTNKTYALSEYDKTAVNQHIDNVSLWYKEKELKVLGLICNDLWGGPSDGNIALPYIGKQIGSQIILHSTNGYRGGASEYDSLTNAWHEGNLRWWSWAVGVPLLSVDNAWNMNGERYDGPTSSQSGITIAGQWVTSVPRIGTQHFYYDFDVAMLQTRKYSNTPWEDPNAGIFKNNG